MHLHGRYFKGTINNILVYNRALSDSEVLHNYNVDVSMRKLTLTVETNIGRHTATITAIGKNGESENLEYTLQINGQTYTSTTGVFNVEGLSEKTTYPYTVSVSDGIDIVTKTGTLTTTATGAHTYGDWIITTAPTCVDEGIQTKTCTVCGAKETETISATGKHNYVNGTCTVCGAKATFTDDGSWDGKVNTPILTADMTPVAWNDDGTEFTPNTNEEWYNYTAQSNGVDGTSRWANAKTSDGSYWVWIPRFEYKITSTTTDYTKAGTIDVNFIPTTTRAGTSGYTTTTTVNQTVAGVEILSKGITVSSIGYIIHPAFTNNVSVGGWSEELAGIWVAKYEMSMEKNGSATTTVDGTVGNVATSSTVKMVSKPGVTSWRYINVSNIYENSLKYDLGKNSHLMKNSEWGAIAYLTHSQYGRNGKEVTINSNSSYYTAGGAGATAITNVAQSSTRNETGIFDLAGCAYEYVAMFNDAYSSTGSCYSKTNTKYKSASGKNMGATGLANGGSTKYLTAYSNGTEQQHIGHSAGYAFTSYNSFVASGYTVSITGDALSEVWVSYSRGWFEGSTNFVYNDNPFYTRGCKWIRETGKGIFHGWPCEGYPYFDYSFRVCLAL